jgi:signal transduction histidine kinase
LKEAGKIVDELVSWSRNFMLDLQVQTLHEKGLVPTLVSLFDRYSARSIVRVNFEHADVPSGLPFETSIAVYRIVQESLADAARYSGVTEMNVGLRTDGGSLLVDICGHNRGGDPTAKEVGDGFAGIAERVELLGGDLRLDSPAESGTCVHARLPL